ncbi:MAG: UDP-N-acetylmuramoyl-tripeptide--D-alanyl-D-alanine ligase [Gammaproteobacteria bacterium]|nr:UDP-N-acetylmuramoyl-tripeptide--D-alanyl-D-alanine ligase [Gammaproteobacteria bacterium]
MTIFFILLLLFALIIHAGYTFYKITQQLHMMQLNSYRNERYLKWLMLHPKQTFPLKDLIPIVSIIPGLIYKINVMNLFITSLWIIIYSALFFFRPREKAKKPLVFTARAKRLYSVNSILLVIIYAASILALLQSQIKLSLWIVLFVLIAVNFLTPVLMIISNTLILPFERMINHWYYRDAQKKLQSLSSLKIIGITGSFGKTTTKYVLNEILKQKYHVLMTPGSFNTTMGVIKIIRNELKPIHEVFIVEMGAKQPGDIKEICDLVHPRYGIISAIGPQHLDTFGNIETIKKTKNELIESLPKNGVAFFNLDNEYCRELSKITNKKVIEFGLLRNKDIYPFQVTDIQVNSFGSLFHVCSKNGECETFQTKLLGEHNISNILGAISIAQELGIPLSDMKLPIKQLEPVPHRLALKRVQHDIIIIDDAFNSNPIGSEMALEVLKKMPGNHKIMITPGMVDLGEKEHEYNKRFGTQMAKACDYIILVGPKQTQPIQEALLEAHFSKERYFVAKNLQNATEHLWKIVKPRDIVLFENDLPDSYAE